MKKKHLTPISITLILFFIFHLSSCTEEPIPNEVPLCEITSPENNTTVDKGVNFKISATASDPDGEIVKVVFYLNDQEKLQIRMSLTFLHSKPDLLNPVNIPLRLLL